jgi:hypothetical protein
MYKMYLSLIDSGSSVLLANIKIVEYVNLDIKLQKKPIKWGTATGAFQTDGSVLIKQHCLHQFTRKH